MVSSGFGMMSFLALFLAGGMLGSGLPVGFPPAEHDPLIDHVAPADCLVYVAWNGKEQNATGQSATEGLNRTVALLSDPEVVQFTSLVKERLNQSFRQFPGSSANEQMITDNVLRFLSITLTHPTAIYIGRPEPLPSAGLVCRLGDDAEGYEDRLEQLEAAIAEESGSVKEEGGIRIHQWPVAEGVPPLQWAIVEDCLLVAFGPKEFENLLARRAAKKTPEWLTEIHQRLPVPRVANVVHINTKSILQNAAPLLATEPQALALVKALGLDSVQSVSCITGLDQTECVSRTWVHTSGAPRGLFKWIDVQPLQKKDLNIIPADANLALAARLDLQASFRQILEIADDVEPGARVAAQSEMRQLGSGFGLDLERDLLSGFGDTWRIYQSDSEGGRLLTGWTAVVSVKDAEKLRNVSSVFRGFVAAQNMRFQNRRQVRIQTFRTGHQEVFFTNFVGEEFPVAPSWCVTDDELIVSLMPQGVKAYLNRDKSTPMLVDSNDAEQLTSDNTVAVFRMNEETVFNTVAPALLMGANMLCSEMQANGINIDISMLPSPSTISRHLKTSTLSVLKADDGIEIVSRRTLPISIESMAATLPVFAAVRTSSFRRSQRGGIGSGLAEVLSPTAARRTTSMNNMKQIMLAMHNFHDVHNSFPAAFTRDSEGKPGLSWRVQLLPFLEQASLFDMFHHDEPWDSDHNKELIKLMPDVFRAPGSSADDFHTNYVGFHTKESILNSSGNPTRMRDVTDGTSNTITFVEADDDHAVLWTKPDDLDVDLTDPLDGLSSPSLNGGFLAALTDGSVRVISELIEAELLRNLIIRNDGNVIGEF